MTVWSEEPLTINRVKEILKHDFDINEVILLKKISKARWVFSVEEIP